MKLPYCALLLLCIVIVQLIALGHIQKWHTTIKYKLSNSTKFVGFRLNLGRLGNQYDANETRVNFGKSCCGYDNPRRLANRTEEYLLLTLMFGQNPRYFEDYIDAVREYLQFSENVQKEGQDLLKSWNITHSDFMCIHIRRGDFVRRRISTDMDATVKATKSIAKKKNISDYMIFGDDQLFMQNISALLVSYGKSSKGTAFVSNFTEIMDLYVSSQICSSFLITAVTSTFGWWLAFFIPNQSDVYYMPDKRPHSDKKPSKELFLRQWKEFSG